jgi:hypothetical protein
MEQSPPCFIAAIPAGVNYFKSISRQVPGKSLSGLTTDNLILLCKDQNAITQTHGKDADLTRWSWSHITRLSIMPGNLDQYYAMQLKFFHQLHCLLSRLIWPDLVSNHVRTRTELLGPQRPELGSGCSLGGHYRGELCIEIVTVYDQFFHATLDAWVGVLMRVPTQSRRYTGKIANVVEVLDINGGPTSASNSVGAASLRGNLGRYLQLDTR